MNVLVLFRIAAVAGVAFVVGVWVAFAFGLAGLGWAVGVIAAACILSAWLARGRQRRRFRAMTDDVAQRRAIDEINKAELSRAKADGNAKAARHLGEGMSGAAFEPTRRRMQ